MNKEDKQALIATTKTWEIQTNPDGSREWRRRSLQSKHALGKKTQSHMSKEEARVAITVHMQVYGTGGKLVPSK